MTCEVFDETGRVLLRIEKAEPECGTDFCDYCGDCLRCFPDPIDDFCSHRWVVYGEQYAPSIRNMLEVKT